MIDLSDLISAIEAAVPEVPDSEEWARPFVEAVADARADLDIPVRSGALHSALTNPDDPNFGDAITNDGVVIELGLDYGADLFEDLDPGHVAELAADAVSAAMRVKTDGR